MGSYPVVICKSCGHQFETQVKIDPAVYRLVPNLRVGSNTFTCPHCLCKADYSEQDFRYTPHQAVELAGFGKFVKAYVEVVNSSPSPQAIATAMLEELREAQRTGNVSRLGSSERWARLKPWLPNNIQSLAAWLVVAEFVVRILSRTPEVPPSPTSIVDQVVESVPHETQATFDAGLAPERDVAADRAPQRPKESHTGGGFDAGTWAAEAGATPQRMGSYQPGGKIGRNDPCPCGSGKKYKRCHGR